MVFRYKESFAIANALEGYERLILLAMIGDQSLFTRSNGIERLWEISKPLLENPSKVEPSSPGLGPGVGGRAGRAVPVAPAGRQAAVTLGSAAGRAACWSSRPF